MDLRDPIKTRANSLLCSRNPHLPNEFIVAIGEISRLDLMWTDRTVSAVCTVYYLANTVFLPESYILFTVSAVCTVYYLASSVVLPES